MDRLDRKILESLQDDFPLTEKPYHVIAEKLGISCEQLFKRVESLVADGIIRRIGPSLDSRKLGFCSSLAAMRVKPEDVEKAAAVMVDIPEITHSYLRDDDFNIWFTIIAENREALEGVLKRIKSVLGLEDSDVLSLPAKRFFKLDVRFAILP